MLRTFRNYRRRRQLTRKQIVCELSLNTTSVGDDFEAWTLCPDLLGPQSVVYSFGVGDNLHLDLDLIDRFGLTVHAFDPTPASIAWVARQKLPPRLQFHPVGLAAHDGTLQFSLPQHGSRFNYRPHEARDGAGPDTVEAPVYRLATHMRRLGHSHLDVLKIDIEGGEYAALKDYLVSPLPVKQLLVEFHHHFPGFGIDCTQRTVLALQQAGFRIFHISQRGLEISFIHAQN